MGFKSGLFGGHTITLWLLKPAFLSQSEVYTPTYVRGHSLLENYDSPERRAWLLLQSRREVLVKELTVGF